MPITPIATMASTMEKAWGAFEVDLLHGVLAAIDLAVEGARQGLEVHAATSGGTTAVVPRTGIEIDEGADKKLAILPEGVRFGLTAIKGLGEGAIRAIIDAFESAVGKQS